MFIRYKLQLLLPVVLGLAIAGCGGGGGGGGGVVAEPVTPPAGLSYLVSNAVYIVDDAVPVNVPTLLEGEAETFDVSPALPAGLSMDVNTGEISGTPTAAQAATNYVITATNSAGSTSATISIAINAPAPAYTSPVTYFVGIAAAPNVLANAAPVATYSIDPALPAGLSIDPATGTISGTPTEAVALTTYEVTESTASGGTVIPVDIAVDTEGPSDLAYDSPVSVFERLPMSDLSPTVSGSPVETYTVDPALPAGLTIDADTGVISGTPAAAVDAADYVIRAENAGGFSEFTLNLTVEVITICDMSYDEAPVLVLPGEELPELLPIVDCALDTFTIAPDLPDGMDMDEDTGEITGSSASVTGAVVYTVSATGVGGFMASTDIEISVACDLEYDSPVVLIPGALAAPLAPASACEFDTYTIDPELPEGLSIDAATGVISGTPDAATPAAAYTVTATGNEGITGTAVVIITAGPIYEYAVENATVTIDDLGEASFSIDITLEEHPDNPGFPNDMAGFQMGLGHDNAFLDATAVTEGSDLTDLNGGSGPDFFLWSIHDDGITLGVVVALDLSDMIIADGPQTVVTVDYDADVDPIAFPDGVTTMLEWRQDLGSPSVANLVSVQDDLGGFGVSESAVVLDGEVELLPE